MRPFLGRALLAAIIFLSHPLVFACELNVDSVDNLAKVFVDGHEVGVVPQKILCGERPLRVDVHSQRQQVFSRYLTPKNKQGPGFADQWNVVFANHIGYRSRTQNILIDGSRAASTNNAFAGTQKHILEEIAFLKAELAKMQMQKNLPSPSRSISSMPIDTQTSLQGYFVQLHSFLETNWDFTSITSELSAIEPSPNSYRVQFCFNKKIRGKEWTQVYWGPFANKSEAKTFAGKIKRDTVLVKDPECKVY